MKEVMNLPDQSEWTQLKEIGTTAFKSGLLPSAIKTPEAATIIILKGRELGLPPMVALSHINVINGKATMSAELMLAYIYKDYPNAEIEIEQKSDSCCIIKAKRPNASKFAEFKWDIERAKKMGLMDKDNYRKQPGTMFFWRAITEMKRAIFPEVLMGIDYDPSEIEDSRDVTPPQTTQAPPEHSAPIAAKTIKNFAPASRQAAENWQPGESTPPSPEQNAPQAPAESKEVQDRKALGLEISKLAAQLKMTKPVMDDLVKSLFNKATAELTFEEMFNLKLELIKKTEAKGA